MISQGRKITRCLRENRLKEKLLNEEIINLQGGIINY
jgi:hypothetical protein